MAIIAVGDARRPAGVSTGIEVCATDQLPVVTATTICRYAAGCHEWTKKEARGSSNRGEQYRREQVGKRADRWRVSGEW